MASARRPFFFFMNLGQHACLKHAEDGIIGSEAMFFFFFLSSKLDSAIDCFSFFLLKRNVQRGNGRK